MANVQEQISISDRTERWMGVAAESIGYLGRLAVQGIEKVKDIPEKIRQIDKKELREKVGQFVVKNLLTASVAPEATIPRIRPPKGSYSDIVESNVIEKFDFDDYF